MTNLMSAGSLFTTGPPVAAISETNTVQAFLSRLHNAGCQTAFSMIVWMAQLQLLA